MVRYMIPIIIAAVVLAGWPAFGQEEPQQRGQRLSAEERAKLRERWQQMSEEERQEFRARMRERLGTGEIGRMGPLRALDQQIDRLRTEHAEFIAELESIQKLAVKERAKETARRLEQLIAKHQKEFEERLQALERRRQRLQEIRRGQQGGTPAVQLSGREAPDFTLKTFDGKTVRLSDYRGKIVVLEWLNFECPFSLYHYETKKTMVTLANDYKDKNVVWLAINSTSHTTAEANKEFARKYNLPYPILDDRSGEVGHAYGAETTPHIFMINSNGVIAYEGAIDNSPRGRTPSEERLVNYVDKALAELTAGRVPSTRKTKPYGCTVKYAR
jgi:peroxiredoxin